MFDAKFDSSIFSKQKMHKNKPKMVRLASAINMTS